MKEIEGLVGALPGLGESEEGQRERMRVLDERLREVEGERVKAVGEREGALKSVDRVIAKLGR